MKKNGFYIFAIIFSFFIYFYVLFLIFSFKPAYEYSMYYKRKLTKYWAGQTTMTISIDKKMLFSYDLNPVVLSDSKIEDVDLQFIGKTSKVKVVNDKLQYVYGDDFYIYWQWTDSVNFDKISVIIELCSDDCDIYINDKMVFTSISCSDFELFNVKINFQKENKIRFCSNSKVSIKQIYFEL